MGSAKKWAIGAGTVAICVGLVVLSTPDVSESIRERALVGDADAQDTLGRMYAHGDSMPQDDCEAVKWFRRAAIQGHVSAQFNLGVSYAEGRGVPQNDAEAVKWFRRAADQGYASAQARLGVFYMAGTGGVARDLVTAHMWFNLAASRLNDDRRDAAVKARDMAAALMTADQITEAQRRAREWRHSQDDSQPDGAGHDDAGHRSFEELLRTIRDSAPPAQDDDARALGQAGTPRR